MISLLCIDSSASRTSAAQILTTSSSILFSFMIFFSRSPPQQYQRTRKRLYLVWKAPKILTMKGLFIRVRMFFQEKIYLVRLLSKIFFFSMTFMAQSAPSPSFFRTRQTAPNDPFPNQSRIQKLLGPNFQSMSLILICSILLNFLDGSSALDQQLLIFFMQLSGSLFYQSLILLPMSIKDYTQSARLVLLIVSPTRVLPQLSSPKLLNNQKVLVSREQSAAVMFWKFLSLRFGFFPFSRITLTTLSNPYMAAQCKGVQRSSSCWSGSHPCSSKITTTSSNPRMQARCKALLLIDVFASTLAPFSINRLVTSGNPQKLAQCRAVHLSRDSALIQTGNYASLLNMHLSLVRLLDCTASHISSSSCLTSLQQLAHTASVLLLLMAVQLVSTLGLYTMEVLSSRFLMTIWTSSSESDDYIN